jgi:repressor LexA
MLRIKEIRKRKKITAKELAEHVSVAESTMSLYENGKREPDFETLSKIARYLEVSVDYLLCISDAEAPNEVPLPSNIFPITRKRFRMLGDISCGQPRYTDEDHETYIEAAGNIQADFCLRAKGDSMIGARIMDGDIVFIREQPMVEDGEIAAVIIDDEATLKRVKYNKEKQQLTLFPANDKYDPLVYIGEELSHIRIIGKAVAFQSAII